MATLTDQASFFGDKDGSGTKDDDEVVYYDLTNNKDDDPATGSEAKINGALFFTDQPDSSSGTGLIQAFVRVQDGGNDDTPGVEDGINTDARPLLHEENTSPSFTTNLLLSAVPVVNIEGTEYYEFRLDINQLNSSPLLSLDELMLFISAPGAGSDDGDVSGLVDADGDGVVDQAFLDANGLTLVYDLDENGNTSILLDYSLQAGSGKSDMFFYVPVANFNGADPETTQVTLYSKFGETDQIGDDEVLVAMDDPHADDTDTGDVVTTLDGDYSANDGFEEWSVSKIFPGVEFTGYKWHDLDGDGVWDDGESALAGWQINYTVEYTITYKGQGGTLTDEVSFAVTTDETGQYTLTVPTFTDNQIQSVEYTLTIYETLQDPDTWYNTYGGYLDSAVSDDPVNPTVIEFTDAQIDGKGDAALNISLVADGQSNALSGKVTISATDLLSAEHMPELLAPLREKAPGIVVHVVPSNDLSDLMRREADIAIRHVKPEQPELIAKRIGDFTVNLYAATELLDRLGRPDSLSAIAQLPMVGVADPDRLVGPLNQMGVPISEANFVASSASGVVIWGMVKAGFGISMLPCFLCDNEPGIEKVFPSLPPASFPVWLVTHRELRTSPRIRMVFDVLAEGLEQTVV